MRILRNIQEQLFIEQLFYHAKNLQAAHIIQFCKNKKYNETKINKTQSFLSLFRMDPFGDTQG